MQRSRQKAGIWWGLVTLTGMFRFGRVEGVKKKSQSLFDVHENQPRSYEGGRPHTDLPRRHRPQCPPVQPKLPQP